jgi:pilus assembly protein CpaB
MDRRWLALVAGLVSALGCGVRPAAPVADEATPSSTASIQKRARSITLPLAGAEWVRPNDHIDILISEVDPQNKDTMAMTVSQNVWVLSVGPMQEPVGDRQVERSVTMLVMPEEAEILLLGVRGGVAAAVLRNPEDIDIQEERGRATLATLLTGERINTLYRKRTAMLAPPEKKE